MDASELSFAPSFIRSPKKALSHTQTTKRNPNQCCDCNIISSSTSTNMNNLNRQMEDDDDSSNSNVSDNDVDEVHYYYYGYDYDNDDHQQDEDEDIDDDEQNDDDDDDEQYDDDDVDDDEYDSDAIEPGNDIVCAKIINDLKGNVLERAFYQDLSEEYVSNENATAMGEALKSNTVVTVLGLKGFYFQRKGFEILVDGVIACPTLQRLSLLGLGSAPVDVSKTELLANQLKDNKGSITRIDLIDYLIGWRGLITILQSLLTNTKIEYLDVSGTMEYTSLNKKIGGTSNNNAKTIPPYIHVGRMVARILKCNTILKSLDLSNNPLGDEFVTIIANELRNPNCVLHDLILIRTGITDDGLIALATSLKTNKKLQVLEVSGNTFTDNGRSAICDLLKLNTPLLGLDIRDDCMCYNNNSWLDEEDDIDCNYIPLIFKALEYNTTLKKIGIFESNIDYNEIMTSQQIRCVVQSLDYNDTIIEFVDGMYAAPKPIRRIIKQNFNKKRIAPKKGGHQRSVIQNWLLTNNWGMLI